MNKPCSICGASSKFGGEVIWCTCVGWLGSQTRRQMTHYHSVDNEPGYLPDAEEQTPAFAARVDARRHALDSARSYADALSDDDRFGGQIVSGIDADLYEVAGRVFEVIECDAPDCEVE